MTVSATSFISTKWWCAKHYVVVALLLTVAVQGFAQVLQTKRWEFPLFPREGDFKIVQAGQHGLYLYRQFAGIKDDQVQLIKLDTAFQEKWRGFLAIDKDYFVVGRRAYGNHLFLLLHYKDYSRNDLLLFDIDETSGNYLRYYIRSYIPFAPTEFQVTEKAAIIGGYFNRTPVVLHYSFANQQSKVVPGLFTEVGELTQVRTYPDGTFDVLICSLTPQRQRTIWIKSYDQDGGLLQNLPLKPDENKHLIFGRSIKTNQSGQVVAGVYANHRVAEFSRGLFISSIDQAGVEHTRYYNFADLKNFFKYMRARREQRIQSRIQRKRVMGKKIRFNYRFLVHELIPYKDQYILLGEAFYPRYITTGPGYGSSFSSFGPSFSPTSMTRSGQVFDGYYYTHAVIMCFDKDGNLLWDNSFEINDVRTFTLEQFVKIEAKPDHITLLYLFENEIRTKIIQGDKVLEGKSRDPISTLNGGDIVKSHRNESKLEYWYNDYLYAYGTQEVEVRTPLGLNTKRVFFINKVSSKK